MAIKQFTEVECDHCKKKITVSGDSSSLHYIGINVIDDPYDIYSDSRFVFCSVACAIEFLDCAESKDIFVGGTK